MARNRSIEARERERKALELRKSGATYETIARALGYSHRQGARRAVTCAIQVSAERSRSADQ